MDTCEIPSVAAILLLDGDGKRIVVRYYRSSFATAADEMAFEKKLFDKTARTNAKNEGAPYLGPACIRRLVRRASRRTISCPNMHTNRTCRCGTWVSDTSCSLFCAAEIIILDSLVTVYRNSCDVWLYVVGMQTENELVLVNVLTALHEALSTLLR